MSSAPLLARSELILENYVALNRMQSVVHPIAMNTNENMLVCGMSFCLLLR